MTVKTKELLSEREAAGYFWKLLELNAVPIITWELDGKISSANDTFLDLIGYSRNEVEAGKINWKTITPEEYAVLDEECIEQLQYNTMADPYEKKYIRKNGGMVKVRLYNALLNPELQQGVAIVIPL